MLTRLESKQMKIEIDYKIGEHEDILSWVTENWWKTPREYIISDYDGKLFLFRSVDRDEMKDFGFGPIFCATACYVLLPISDDGCESTCEYWTCFESDGKIMDDLDASR